MSAKLERSDAAKQKRRATQPKREEPSSRQAFSIVGVGASAGGLEEFEQFFLHLPPDTGMAFIVIQHLDPTGDSLLPDLLRRYTHMEVVEARYGVEVQPNVVYVIPPNRDLSIEGGTLSVQEAHRQRGIRMPIDHFFRHLAEDQDGNACGIILSGTGTDGTLGVKAIKEKMGLVLVQDPASASFSGMPQSAINTGLVDYIGPAEELPKKLIAYASSAASTTEQPPLENTSEIVQQILFVLRSETGHNFAGLKQNMLIRRIERRRDILGLPSLKHYLSCLQQHDTEAQLLYKDLLIGVTNFFRESDAWGALKNVIKSELLTKPPTKSLRIWDVGCSTGEEAYSLAMTLEEVIDEVDDATRPEFQIFATDMDADSIDVARRGMYYPNITLDVSAQRLSRFFTKEDAHYRIKENIREHIIFAAHDVERDPPFTKLDILVCRNLLIYFTPELQQKILPLFHYSLKPGGILFLGSAESIGKFEDYFSSLDNKWKLFLNRPDVGDMHFDFPYRAHIPEHAQTAERTEYLPTLRDTVQFALLNAYAPAAIVVNRDGDIVYFFGKTGQYLEPTTGKASLNVQTLAREGLRLGLSNAIYQAAHSTKEVLLKGLTLQEDDAVHTIDLRVRPLDQAAAVRDLLLVTFEQHPQPARSKARRSRQKAHELVQGTEILALRERIKSCTEEMETSREEFKSTMEELQSTNEELQSTNEELNSSREELQLLNEELMTVNSELKEKNDELVHTSSDMRNLLDSTELATLFVDVHLRITRFTPAVISIFNLIVSDLGRPLSDIATNVVDSSLIDDIGDVFRSGITRETQVKMKNGTWYKMRVMPYRTIDSNSITGAVVTFVDISLQKAFEAEIVQEVGVLDQGDGIIEYDCNGMILFWNKGAEALYGWPGGEVIGKDINSLLESAYPLPFDEIKSMLRDSQAWTGRVKRRRRDGTYTTDTCQLLLRHNKQGEPAGILEVCNGRQM
ncbi:MAG: chemotaxis protein CheB [Halobacteriota archaeon]